MKYLYKVSLALFIFMTFLSCNNDDDSSTALAECDVNYTADAITSTFSGVNGYTTIAEGKPLETHFYAIRILSDGIICSVGYQNPTNYSGTYKIRITNNNNGFIYEDVFSFSQTGLEYHDISEILNVQSGDYISVWRTISPGYSDINQAKGKIIERTDNAAIPYPITGTNVKFLTSDFEDGGISEYETAIPFISLGFKVE